MAFSRGDDCSAPAGSDRAKRRAETDRLTDARIIKVSISFSFNDTVTMALLLHKSVRRTKYVRQPLMRGATMTDHERDRVDPNDIEDEGDDSDETSHGTSGDESEGHGGGMSGSSGSSPHGSMGDGQGASSPTPGAEDPDTRSEDR
jgi:hypothetical protein